MGSPDAANGEFPLHPVTISRPFFLGKYEVTKGQFKKFVEEASYVTDAEADGAPNWGYTADAHHPFEARPEFNWADWGVDQSDASPVVNVSWNDAMAFCYWLSQKEGKVYRLPTEAEWEYACRAGTTTRFYNGDDPEALTQIGNVWDAAAKAQFPAVLNQLASSDGWAFTSPSAKFQPNNFGLYDMTGNAREWCSDWYDKNYYANSPELDPAGPASGTVRVSRGGGWNSPAAQCSSARRGYGEPSARDFNLGFRVVQGGVDVQTGWTIQDWERQIHRHRLPITVRHTEVRTGGKPTTHPLHNPVQTTIPPQQTSKQIPSSGSRFRGQFGGGTRRR
jgi:formylglycine-generating enzyme required for sulfatase activity